MSIKEFNPSVRREVDPILLDALNKIFHSCPGLESIKYAISAFSDMAKEYYPEILSSNNSDYLGIQ